MGVAGFSFCKIVLSYYYYTIQTLESYPNLILLMSRFVVCVCVCVGSSVIRRNLFEEECVTVYSIGHSFFLLHLLYHCEPYCLKYYKPLQALLRFLLSDDFTSINHSGLGAAELGRIWNICLHNTNSSLLIVT